MICGTSNTSSLLKNAIPRSQQNTVAICSISEIFEYMLLDPATKDPQIDAFVISSNDVRPKAIAEKFDQALRNKHQDTKVVFISKDGKQTGFTNNPNISKCLIKPKAQQVADAIFMLSAQLSEKPIVKSSSAEAAKLNPKEVKINVRAMVEEPEEPEEQIVETLFTDEELPTIIEPEKEMAATIEEPDLVRRIRSAGSVADIVTLSREISAEELLKGLAKENASYEVIEHKLQSIKEDINEVMITRSLSLEEKYDKIRSIVYSKKHFTQKSNTLIERYVTEIIESMAKNAAELLTSRLSEIDNSIKLSVRHGNGTQNFGRLTGINEERSNIIMELYTLKAELQEIATRTADALHTLTADVASKNQELTGNPLIDSNLTAHGAYVLDGESITILRSLLETADRTTDEFKESVHCVTALMETFSRLMETDKEQIAAINEVVKYIQANNLEDTIVANTLLKKSLRVFIGPEGVGRTILPYMLSKNKSRQNYNVLLIDLTGTTKYDDYDIEYKDLDDYRVNRYEKDFVVVKGTCTSVESAQNLIAVLTRAADFYRVINVVLPLGNMDVVDVISHDVLAINYITNTKKRNMEIVKKLMADTVYENVAKRLIVNDSSLTLTDSAMYFGLLDKFDYQILSLPHIEQVEVCSLNKIDPLTISYVCEQLVEVNKYV